MDAYESLADQLYQKGRQSHLRLLADDLTAFETTPHSNPVITHRTKPSPSNNGVASIRPTQPAYIGRQDTRLHVTPSVLDKTYATIHAKPGLEARIRPHPEVAFNIEYNGDETMSDTVVSPDCPVQLLSRTQLVNYLRSDHREPKKRRPRSHSTTHTRRENSTSQTKPPMPHGKPYTTATSNHAIKQTKHTSSETTT